MTRESLNNYFKLTRFAFDVLQKFEAVPSELKSFPSPSDTQESYNEKLIYLVFSVRTVSYGSSFFPPSIYGQSVKLAGHKSRGKSFKLDP